MFDVGFAELLFLSLIALLVLGPERLPKVARTLGALTRKARSSWLSLKRSIDEEMRQQDLKEPVDSMRKDFQSTVDEFKSSVDEVKGSADEIRGSANKLRDEVVGKDSASSNKQNPSTEPHGEQ